MFAQPIVDQLDAYSRSLQFRELMKDENILILKISLSTYNSFVGDHTTPIPRYNTNNYYYCYYYY